MTTIAFNEEVPRTCPDTKKSERSRPHVTFRRLDGQYAAMSDALFNIPDCMVQVNPGRVILPPNFADISDSILDLQVLPDDVWLVSYPRTGSTWTQEMVWCIGNDLDFEGAKMLSNLRMPLLELTAVFGHEKGEWKNVLGDSVSLVESLPSPRFIKSHLPLELLPTQIHTVKPKIVYIARNPKDMCVSYYHYCMLVHDLKGPFEDFCELFLNDHAPFGPIWNHYLGFWKLRNEPNILFLKYEDMKKDLKGVIRKTAEFLGKKLNDEDVNKLSEHLSFNSMRKNPALNLEPIMEQKNGPEFLQKTDLRFIRKGEIGDHKNYMSPELIARFDAWSEENLKGSDLRFD